MYLFSCAKETLIAKHKNNFIKFAALDSLGKNVFITFFPEEKKNTIYI